jgi:glycosyltransferase involved in cell wall biosynthesis
MRAFFHPYWPQNPYQPLLKASLKACGVEIEPLRVIKSRLPEHSILHLHWLPSSRLSASGIFRMVQFIHHLRRQSRAGLRIVWTAHNLIPHESRFPVGDLWLAKRVASIADVIIAHSECARKQLIEALGINPKKVHVILHGNYIGHYKNNVGRQTSLNYLNLPSNTKNFLFFGHIRPYKGLNRLLSSFSNANLTDCLLVIAGQPANPTLDAKLRATIRKHPNIRYFPGFIPDEQLQYFFNAADVVVFPYENILTSGAVVLAMSFGKACIAPRLGAIPDYLDSSGAFLYDDIDSGLATSLQLAANSSTLNEMGAKNAKRALEWNWKSIGEATYSLYTGRAQFSEDLDRTLEAVK